MVVVTIKKSIGKFFICLVIILIIISLTLKASKIKSVSLINEELSNIVKEIIITRNIAILSEDTTKLKSLFDINSKYGRWAYEHEFKKMKYLHMWSEKQGVEFLDIKSTPLVRWAKERGAGYRINLISSTEYEYVYINDLETHNKFKIGTYHSLDIINKDGEWVVSREWYTDPFSDSLSLNENNTVDINEYILSHEKRDFSNLIERRINAIEYADRYCGAANNSKDGYKYNKKYRNYNSLGGDCANFASQILYEGGKFRKNQTWNYDKGGSKAWVNASDFKSYMLYSGRASLIAYGSYEKVYKASYKLLPGDFIAYGKKGKITHISTVTGADSKGYALVNCHNTDRYKVPWDLGWSDKGIKFWLVHVHY